MIEHDNDREQTRAVLVTVLPTGDQSSDSDEALDELENLADTLGLQSASRHVVRTRQPSPRYLVGRGKVDELASCAREAGAEVIVFDDDLSPSQQRNWEQRTGLTTIDRHQLILDIFGKRATTREARLQVELAQAEYELPRLTRAWSHLSRQKGGTRGTRGEGEKQLENDRRMVLQRIHKLRNALEEVEKQRATQRKQRHGIPVPTGSIVGYTNAGKSSLLRSLTGAEVLVEDKLFATLDATSRKVPLSSSLSVVLTDTVGFIRKLPHDLVDAFHSTLEETVLADFLIHVVDAASPSAEEYHRRTGEVLSQIGAEDKPVITVLNKVDLVDDESRLTLLEHAVANGGPCVRYSSRTGAGSDALKAIIEELASTHYPAETYRMPHDRHDLVALAHRSGRVLGQEYESEGVILSARLPERVRERLTDYRISSNGASRST